MKLLLKVLLFVLIFPHYSCKKISSGTPKCIKELIRKEKKTECLKEVYSYNYMGKNVYYFIPEQNCADFCWSLIDENCNVLTDKNGNTICQCNFGQVVNCDDFIQNRTNEKLIWRK